MLICVTGGIASGKSSLCQIWETLGAHVVSSDIVAREVVEPGESAYREIQNRWGHSVLTPDGNLDRSKLAEIVFSDESELHALNRITHPAIFDRTWDHISSYGAADIVVLDIPLLVGSNMQYEGVANVSVSVARNERLRRMVEIRGMSAIDAAARLRSQPTDTERADISDLIVSNDGSRSDLQETAEHLWTHWILPFQSALVEGERRESSPDHMVGGFKAVEKSDVVRARLRHHKVDVEILERHTRDFYAQRVPPENLAAAGWVPTTTGAVPANPFHRRILHWS